MNQKPTPKPFAFPPAFGRTVSRCAHGLTGARRHRKATRGKHDHDVLGAGRADPSVDRPVVVRRETPNGNLYLVEKIREGGAGVLAAHREFGCHNEPLVIALLLLRWITVSNGVQ